MSAKPGVVVDLSKFRKLRKTEPDPVTPEDVARMFNRQANEAVSKYVGMPMTKDAKGWSGVIYAIRAEIVGLVKEYVCKGYLREAALTRLSWDVKITATHEVRVRPELDGEIDEFAIHKLADKAPLAELLKDHAAPVHVLPSSTDPPREYAEGAYCPLDLELRQAWIESQGGGPQKAG
jgi:hypothetical protein